MRETPSVKITTVGFGAGLSAINALPWLTGVSSAGWTRTLTGVNGFAATT
jgi:hypothetical protein